MSTETTSPEEMQLLGVLKQDPSDWEARKHLAHLLYDRGDFQKAADIVWAAEELPNIDLELAFAARVLAKASPRKAIRLLTAVLELNQGKAVQNLGLANALLHHGMVLQAARFYGAALETDPSLGNPDLEHFILWTDDEETLWGDFKDRRPQLGELPWMKRDPKEAMKLTSAVSRHTTPVRVASLKPAPGEELRNELYQQKAEKGAQPSPPPAVTIPVDRVDPKHRRFDPELGAPDEAAAKEPAAASKQDATAAAKPAEKPEPAALKPPEKAEPATAEPPAKASGPPRPDIPAAPAKAAPKKPSLPPLKTSVPGATQPAVPGSASGPRKLQFATPPAKGAPKPPPADDEDS